MCQSDRRARPDENKAAGCRPGPPGALPGSSGNRSGHRGGVWSRPVHQPGHPADRPRSCTLRAFSGRRRRRAARPRSARPQSDRLSQQLLGPESQRGTEIPDHHRRRGDCPRDGPDVRAARLSDHHPGAGRTAPGGVRSAADRSIVRNPGPRRAAPAVRGGDPERRTGF